MRDGYSATTVEELAAAAAARAAAAAAAAAAQAEAVEAAAQKKFSGPEFGTDNDSARTDIFTGVVGEWQRPVSGPISSPYGPRRIICNGGGCSNGFHDGVESIYGHLQSGSFRVSVGDSIGAGTAVANVGATVVVSGCHLDLKIRISGSFTNLTPYLRARGVSL
ncbi:M23 family metallopeptidase [Mycetocola miduiensis]|uniref:Peptidase family M23 n=1 Tax=Mycetocola miduiensis TaxID=995034 RepID=A0A1I5AHS9_9MICO|nr:M23 family metallopeptidase [Mycetocola miduiensis]SFN61932.1 Peptidase family M23 [Mycetocola miduiensis]